MKGVVQESTLGTRFVRHEVTQSTSHENSLFSACDVEILRSERTSRDYDIFCGNAKVLIKRIIMQADAL